MKKDIEWLREEVYALYPNSYSAYALNDMVLKTEMVDKIIELINQLDEPKKPVIPQFVADYIEKWKHEGLTIYEWLSFGNNDVDEDIYKWLYYSLNEKNRRREYLLIDAIRFGYEVEKEPVYYAKIKGHELVQTETIIEDGRDVSEWNRNVYFVLQKDGQIIVDMKESCLSGAKHVMAMSQWNNLGINDSNADFEEVE